MIALRTPLQEGFGRYMQGFYESLVADTPSMVEFISRGLSKSIVWAPTRMIDSAEAMLAEWRKNDNDDGPGTSSYLPIMLVAMSNDFVPSFSEWSPTMGEAIDVAIPDDPEQRHYKVRLSCGDYRTQILFAAAESQTAHSLILQFNLWTNRPGGRRFSTSHAFAGGLHEFPAVLEQSEIGGITGQTDQKNLTMLVADLNIRATTPIFQAPKLGEPNDGKSAPAGYPVVLDMSGVDRTSTTTPHAFVGDDGNPTHDFQP